MKFFVLGSLAFSLSSATLAAPTTSYLPQMYVEHAQDDSGGRIYANSPATFRVPLDRRAVLQYPWTEAQGLIYGTAGQTFRIDYRRSAGSLGQAGEIVAAKLQYRLPGEQQVREVSTDADPEDPRYQFDVPTTGARGGTLEYWFLIETSAGVEFYDSQFGQNYAVILLPATCAVASFGHITDPANWPVVALQGSLAGGSALCIYYDRTRAYELGLRDNFYRGVTIQPSVKAFARYFDAQGNVTNDAEIYLRAETGTVALPIPAGTKKVSLWFEAAEYGGRTQWDSQFGANYDFDVQ